MKALIIPTMGDPVVVRGEWDDLVAMLNSEDVDSYKLPAPPEEPVYVMGCDTDPERLRPVNRVATSFAGDALPPGRYIPGAAFLSGYDRETGTTTGLGLMDIIKLGAKLVRVERAAIPG